MLIFQSAQTHPVIRQSLQHFTVQLIDPLL
jgi:hypothetical protein